MYCKACGKQIDSDSAFCKLCGAPQIAANATTSASNSIPRWETCIIRAVLLDKKTKGWLGTYVYKLEFRADAFGVNGRYTAASSNQFIAAVPDETQHKCKTPPCNVYAYDDNVATKEWRSFVDRLLKDGWDRVIGGEEVWYDWRFRRLVSN